MAAGFGKLPSEGDFVRHELGRPSLMAFERWVYGAVERAHERLGHGFAAALAGAPPHGFVQRFEGELVVGVIGPSRDSVGRSYPFVVAEALALAPFAAAPHVLPLACGDFYEAAGQLLAGIAHANAQAVRARLGAVPPPAPAMAPAALHEYRSWAESTTLAGAFTVLFGAELALAPHALDLLLQCVEPWRGKEAPATELSVRVPLGRGGPAAVALWLDIVRHSSLWNSTVPSHFWCWDGERGALLIQLGKTPDSALSELWFPDPNSVTTCDLSVAPRSVQPQSTPRSRALFALFARAHASVAELLHVLAS